MLGKKSSHGLGPLGFASLAAALLLSGCAGQFNEVHLLATVNPETNETDNIFRVTVKGDVSFTNARYLAGFFDERAVESFFNETKAQTLDYSKLSGTGVPVFFPLVPCADPTTDECKTKTQAATKLVPLGSKASGEGVFVLLLSTNPDAIASTINSFVDNDQVVQSAMYLATKGDREKVATIAATKTTTDSNRASTTAAIGKLLDKAEGKNADGTPGTKPPAVDQRAYYLAVLQEAAAGIAPNSTPKFTTVAEAKSWFDALPRSNEK